MMVYRQVHRAAQYLGWAALAAMLTVAGLLWMLSSDWFLNWINPPGQWTHSPWLMIVVCPDLVLILGFLVIVAALCGGFRRS